MPIQDFTVKSFEAAGISHAVYSRGKGLPVLLMHELPGMSDACIALAEELSAADFRVHMPLLFGAPRAKKPLLYTLKLCISREIRLFAQGGGSPIVDWLRALCQKIREESGARGVGVIGMCLTGNFAISLMADESVLAPVASQPGLPLGFTAASRAAFAVPASDLAAAARRNVAGVPLLCLRFSEDRISPKERFAAIKAAFPANFEGIEISSAPGNAYGISPRAHSVLTYDFCDQAGHPTRQARDRVIAFMREHLLDGQGKMNGTKTKQ